MPLMGAKPQVAMKNRDCSVSELCNELGISRQALYKYVVPDGELRKNGKLVLAV
ncbi:Putative resolvase [Moritella viscosa]|nr:Putative resolvase [Moritella viscosa]